MRLDSFFPRMWHLIKMDGTPKIEEDPPIVSEAVVDKQPITQMIPVQMLNDKQETTQELPDIVTAALQDIFDFVDEELKQEGRWNFKKRSSEESDKENIPVAKRVKYESFDFKTDLDLGPTTEEIKDTDVHLCEIQSTKLIPENLNETSEPLEPLESTENLQCESAEEEDEDDLQVRSKYNILPVVLKLQAVTYLIFCDSYQRILDIKRRYDTIVHDIDKKTPKKLSICNDCMAHRPSAINYILWHPECQPNGRLRGHLVYQKDNLMIREVDGATPENNTFCHNLCLMAGKYAHEINSGLELVKGFVYYVVYVDGKVAGFYSKQKDAPEHSLSVYFVLPSYQGLGIGKLMAAFSHHVSHLAGKLGTPERKFSRNGIITFSSFWLEQVKHYTKNLQPSLKHSLKRMSRETFITEEDLILAFLTLGEVHKYYDGFIVTFPEGRRSIDHLFPLKAKNTVTLNKRATVSPTLSSSSSSSSSSTTDTRTPSKYKLDKTCVKYAHS